ncbi:ArnT family glycosyltransferase [Nocardia sp. NPDC050175]|uniref:ArnT family glycosyltransferase n=1 Tax=Nocardia sp. NPDC050175 TaxID=3364317 RepID=UPI0037A8A38E
MTADTSVRPAASRWRFWRSPQGQPAWARPALLAVAAVTAVLYGWGIGSEAPHLYYAAAVRSMSMSWHNFFFAAFDPDATIGIDKLPGAFWVQTLSVRIFGPHLWAYLLPQVVEGVLTILVLYRAVRRLSSPVAAIVAVVVAALIPATVALNRGNVADTLLVLLLVLAADQAAAAIESGRTRNMVYAGVFVGLAFQAKMVQAWIVVPVIAIAVLVCAPRERLRQRITATVLFGVVALTISLAWMSVVSLVPDRDRPYADGSQDNSLFEQVFVYNAASRANDSFTVGAANFSTGKSQAGYRAELVLGPENRFDHVFGGGGGREIGWLVPLALLGLIVLSVLALRRPRVDPGTGAVFLWGGWLVIHLAAFLIVGTVNPYYLAVLTPAIAALIGMGVVAFVRSVHVPGVRVVGIGAAVATVAYGGWLLGAASSELRWVTVGVALICCVAAVFVRGARVLPVLLVAVLAAPAVASASVVADDYGPLDTPFESAQARQVTQGFLAGSVDQAAGLMEQLRKSPGGERYPLMTYTSVLASPFILATGTEIPSIGGFTGRSPVPTTAEVARMIEGDQVGLVLISPADDDRITWITQHCKKLPDTGDGPGLLAYFCGRR